MSIEGVRPHPAMTHDTAPWWQGLAEHKLLIQHCDDCGHLQHPPEPACMACGSFAVGWIEASGRGEVFSFIVYHEPKVPGFELPYAVVLATLAEGTRLVASFDGSPDDVAIGKSVAVDFLRVDDGLTVPVFRLDETHGGAA